MHAHFKRIHIIYNINTVHRIYGYMANPCIEERERETKTNKGTCFLSLLSQLGNGIQNQFAGQFQPVKIARFSAEFPPQESGGSDSVVSRTWHSRCSDKESISKIVKIDTKPYEAQFVTC